MNVDEEVKRYDGAATLERAETPPSSWYTHPLLAKLEERSVFSNNWIIVGRAEQVHKEGQYFTVEIAGEPQENQKIQRLIFLEKPIF